MEYLPVFIFNLILLAIAAGLLVKFASKLAYRIHLSPLIIGSTIIAIGTSLPETSVAVSSLIQGVPNLSMGDIIGSNIVNVSLVLGLSIFVFPVRVGTQKTQRNNIILILLTFCFISISLFPLNIRHFLGYSLLLFYPIFLVFEIIWGEIGSLKEDKKALLKNKVLKGNPLFYLAAALASLVLIIISSQYLVQTAVKIALLFKVETEVIGLSLVAIGTSLPELVTSIASGFKKEWKILYGDIQGSNIFNLSVLGAVLLSQQSSVGHAQIPSLIFLGLTSSLIFILTGKYQGRSIPRFFGLLFILMYVSYLKLIY